MTGNIFLINIFKIWKNYNKYWIFDITDNQQLKGKKKYINYLPNLQRIMCSRIPNEYVSATGPGQDKKASLATDYKL